MKDRKKPYRIGNKNDRESLKILAGLLVYIGNRGEIPRYFDPAKNESLRELCAGWSGDLRKILRGDDARVVMGQAPGRGEKKPNIAADVAATYWRLDEPLDTRAITCARVRGEMPAARELTDETIIRYSKRFKPVDIDFPDLREELKAYK